MAESPGSVLRCQRLSVASGSGRSWHPSRRSVRAAPALEDLDLHLHPGQRTWLVGDLDPGVAALLDVIRGERPATGSLRLGGTELVGASRRTRARALARVEVWQPLAEPSRRLEALELGAEEVALLVICGPVAPAAAEIVARLRQGGTAVLHLDDRLPCAVEPGETVAVVCGGRVVEVLDAGSVADPAHPFTRALATDATGSTGAHRTGHAGAGCPFAAACVWAQERCEVMPPLTVPLGGHHPVACHFPAAGVPDADSRRSAEPTAREFAQGL